MSAPAVNAFNDPTELEPEAEGAASLDSIEDISGWTKAVVSLYSLWILLIIVGNLFVAVLILKNKTLRGSMANMYITSVLLARACIGFFVVPARVTGMFSERYLGCILCKLCHFTALGSSATSVFCIATTAWMQCRIIQGDPKITQLRMKHHVLLIAMLWTAGFVYGIRAYIVNDIVLKTTTDSAIWACTITPQHKNTEKYFVFVDLVLLFLIPAAIIVFSYITIGRNIARNMDRNAATVENATRRKSLKTIQFLIALVTFFILCSLSPMALKIYTLWSPILSNNLKSIEAGVYLFSYANSWAHLIILLSLRPEIRTEVAQVLCCLMRNPHSLIVNEEEAGPDEKATQETEMSQGSNINGVPSITANLEWREKKA